MNTHGRRRDGRVADNTFFRYGLLLSLRSEIKLVELDAHINDESFARAAANLLLESLEHFC